MMTTYGGAVYNHYLAKQMNLKTEDLRQTVQEWNGKSLIRKVLSCLNPFVDAELKYKTAKELIDARENPNGEIAQKINWRLEEWKLEASRKE